MKSKKIVIVLLLLTLTLYPKQFAPVGTTVAQFLEIGVGARGTALGEATTTIVDGACAVFWNPANIVDLKGGRIEGFSSLTSWPAGITLGAVSLGFKLGNIGTFAISSLYLKTDDMEITTVFKPNGTGEYFRISNYCVGLSYSRYLTDRVSIGLTTKVIHEGYFKYGYTTWGLDMGTLYRTNFHNMKIGMSILHFGPEVRFSGEYIDYSDPKSYSVSSPKEFELYSLPINFRFGVSLDLLNTGSHRITTSGDLIHPNNNLEQYNIGLEYSISERFFLRSGYRFSSDNGKLSFGGGLKANISGIQIVIDYAYSDLGVLTNANRFSLSFTM